MPPLFSADSIVKSFGARRVLKAASIWTDRGRITAVFGRNGCGKSTLLKIGAGVIAPDSGVVHFNGTTYLRPRLHRLAAAGLFYLPDRDLLSPRWSVRDHLAAVEWRFHGGRCEEALDALGIGERADRRPHTLSGGERRRAELALAWVRRPSCLLADEPFAGINPSDARVVATALTRLASDGCAVVVTGHEVPELMSIADDVVWMTAGTTHGLGSADDAERHDQFRREYLGPGRGQRPPSEAGA